MASFIDNDFPAGFICIKLDDEFDRVLQYCSSNDVNVTDIVVNGFNTIVVFDNCDINLLSQLVTDGNLVHGEFAIYPHMLL